MRIETIEYVEKGKRKVLVVSRRTQHIITAIYLVAIASLLLGFLLEIWALAIPPMFVFVFYMFIDERILTEGEIIVRGNSHG